MSNIRTEELDFDAIKANIKEFFRGQSIFTDYDFEGSALSVLIDVLAYTTQYNAFYANLAINEMFLDSASKYASAVSLAKTIGYTPRSIRSARGVIDVVTSNVQGNPSTLTLPKNTVFRGKVGEVEYDFYTATDYTANNVLGAYTFNDVEIIEGSILTKKYNVMTNSKFVIPNKNVDMSTLTVRVQDNPNSGNYIKFNLSEDILNVRSTDSVYFVKQREDMLYEIYFGNGTIGKKVNVGNVVHIEYFISSGRLANQANEFVYASGLEANYTYNVALTTIPTGGDEEESIDSIKFNAPRKYISQNRAVTSEDYATLLYSQFPNIESLSVWGGQDNVPPIYGKVFIAAKPFERETFTDAEKAQIRSFLASKRNILTVIPETVDPTFLRVQFTTNVYYDPAKSKKSPGELQTLVRNTIADYATTMGKFDSTFRFSKLSTLIDATDQSINSNISTLKIRRTVEPVFGVISKYNIQIDNPIYQDKDTGGTVWSTRFFIGTLADRCYIRDDGNGNMDLYMEDINGNAFFQETIGTVDYGNGTINIPSLLIRGLYDGELEFMYTPSSNDVVPTRQYIVTIPNELVTVNMIADQKISGSTKQKHIFTSSR
jgi:hypothetical protein